MKSAGNKHYDGISIAWAITEYLHEHPAYRSKVLFATHYHELNEMAASFSRIRNYHVSVKETGKNVIFLRKLKKAEVPIVSASMWLLWLACPEK